VPVPLIVMGPVVNGALAFCSTSTAVSPRQIRNGLRSCERLRPFAVQRVFEILRGSSAPPPSASRRRRSASPLSAFLLFEPDGLIEIYRRTATYFERWPFRYRELRASGRQ
jgi:hypothetical protein